MSYVALYRKYRSQTFDDLVGQEHITKTLQSSVETGRFVHAYLFTGPRGTGKTSAARILAKALNCEKGPTPHPCNACRMCRAITAGSGVDVIEMDAASEAGVEQVRENIVERASFAPMDARYRVYIIDEVHDLSPKAFDALLKTIEEPPPHVIFILATTEFTKVPVTIRSRCQRYEFHRGTLKQLVKLLEYVCNQERLSADRNALYLIARMADGGFRDALTLLEQVIITCGNEITTSAVMQQLGLLEDERVNSILEAAISGDVAALITAAGEAVASGKDPQDILSALLYRLSELTYAAHEVPWREMIEPERQAADHALAVRIGPARLLRFRSLLAEAHKEIRSVSLPRLWLEVALLRLVDEPAQVFEQQKQAAESDPVIKASDSSQVSMAHDRPDVPRELQDAWTRATNAYKSRYPGAGQLVAFCKFITTEGNTAVIEVAGGFAYKRITQRDDHVRALTQEFRRAAGNDSLTLRFVQADGAEVKSDAEAAVQSPVEGQALVELVEDVLKSQQEQYT